MSYKSAKADAGDAVEANKPPSLPCQVCKRITDHKTLADHGGMCYPCYSAWRNRPLAQTPDVGDKAKNGEKDWASALRRRELAGERLTPFQRDAWRAALKPQESSHDEA